MSYIVKPLSYVLVIMLGYLLKRAGFFGKADHRLISKIMINVTMPCTIVRAFSSFTRDTQMFIIVGIGFALACLPMVLMYLTTRGVDTRLRAYRMLNIGGYNIGCFSMPLIEVFFSSTGVITACMFDTGNAVMMTGGSYAMTSTLLKTGGEEKESAKDILMKFLKSAPFDTYMIMFALAALNVKIPETVFTLVTPAANANAFLAMLMIGMMFEPAGDRAMLREAARELAIRYALAVAFALGCFFLTPFDLIIRQTLVVICFGPLSSLAPIYTDRCRSDAALASFTNSASIAVSLVLMLAISMFFVA